jgi:4-coumarate--CoA ligase
MEYHRNFETTRETFDMLHDRSGWMGTNNETTFEFEHRQHWIVDRLKELVKVLGNYVTSVEIESILLSHPRIDVAIVANPSEKTGNMPYRFVPAKGETRLIGKKVTVGRKLLDTRDRERLFL